MIAISFHSPSFTRAGVSRWREGEKEQLTSFASPTALPGVSSAPLRQGFPQPAQCLDTTASLPASDASPQLCCVHARTSDSPAKHGCNETWMERNRAEWHTLLAVISFFKASMVFMRFSMWAFCLDSSSASRCRILSVNIHLSENSNRKENGKYALMNGLFEEFVVFFLAFLSPVYCTLVSPMHIFQCKLSGPAKKRPTNVTPV